MKITSLLILSFFLNFTEVKNKNQSQLECTDFKNGKFELINTKDNKKYIIERKDSTQSEETFDLKTGKIIRKRFFNIKWINDCEFNLTIDTVKNKYDDLDIYINSKGGINNQILNIENNCANIRSSIDDFKIDCKVCKIE